ncbi:MAG: hypothetical protein EKK63_09110 [Acinetobacter sp.]|uniref:hypothetical protein n=1 Tax=Acinetobacter sp. TaxID=472 RepID=UPI000F902FA6|nr:hypothetical protein [Acinetobacter sp.]RUP39786.1 MAG: hypothetical protein EKK63_09110 [Acinetobacter sp.]
MITPEEFDKKYCLCVHIEKRPFSMTRTKTLQKATPKNKEGWITIASYVGEMAIPEELKTPELLADLSDIQQYYKACTKNANLKISKSSLFTPKVKATSAKALKDALDISERYTWKRFDFEQESTLINGLHELVKFQNGKVSMDTDSGVLKIQHLKGSAKIYYGKLSSGFRNHILENFQN